MARKLLKLVDMKAKSSVCVDAHKVFGITPLAVLAVKKNSSIHFQSFGLGDVFVAWVWFKISKDSHTSESGLN